MGYRGNWSNDQLANPNHQFWLCNWLLKIGLTPNKSLSIEKIDIDYKYFPDFLRGNIDGDGSIIYYKDKYHTLINTNYVYDRLFVYFLSASKKYILWIQKTIQTIIKISGSVQTKGLSKNAKRDRQMYLLKFSTKEAKILLNYVYYKKNLPYLKRKYLMHLWMFIPGMTLLIMEKV